MEELKEQIKVVVEARREYQEMADKKKAFYDEFQTKHCDFFGDVASAAIIVSEAEDILRELTLQNYKETGNKAPEPGVGIREVSKLLYDPKTALNWAIEHKMALKLDTSAFAKIAKASPPDFVSSIPGIQATISPNLEG